MKPKIDPGLEPLAEALADAVWQETIRILGCAPDEMLSVRAQKVMEEKWNLRKALEDLLEALLHAALSAPSHPAKMTVREAMEQARKALYGEQDG